MLSGFGAAPTNLKVRQYLLMTRKKCTRLVIQWRPLLWHFSITEEAIEDNLYDRLASRYTKALARSMSQTKQVKAAAVLNNAFDSTYTGGDGLELCSTAHTLANGSTFRNELSTAADLNETSLEQALIDIAGFVDERGLKVRFAV
jgi:hypothetical protein